MLICADLEDPRLVGVVNALKPALVFNPASVSAPTDREGPIYAKIVEGAKQSVEALLRGDETYRKQARRLLNHEIENLDRERYQSSNGQRSSLAGQRSGLAEGGDAYEEADARERRVRHKWAIASFASGGVARAATVVRTDYPFPARSKGCFAGRLSVPGRPGQLDGAATKRTQ